MKKLTKEYLHEILSYSQDTGTFTWKVSKGNAGVGGIAGTNIHGYIRIGINGVIYPAHHLAWLYVYGELPNDEIDHINLNKSDNRIVNLRKASHSDNQRNRKIPKNNTSGVKGVVWHKRIKKWMAQGRISGKNYHLGYFTNLVEAEFAAKKFREKHHGNFVNHG